MNGFDCSVANSGRRRLQMSQPPQECSENPAACVQGAKQPLYWSNERPNIAYHGRGKLPSYRNTWGFVDGAQNDIFREPEEFRIAIK